MNKFLLYMAKIIMCCSLVTVSAPPKQKSSLKRKVGFVETDTVGGAGSGSASAEGLVGGASFCVHKPGERRSKETRLVETLMLDAVSDDADVVSALATAVKKLQEEETVALPTETVYGLAADARSATAVNKIFAAKGRPTNHPLIVHVESFAKVSEWAFMDAAATEWAKAS